MERGRRQSVLLPSGATVRLRGASRIVRVECFGCVCRKADRNNRLSFAIHRPERYSTRARLRGMSHSKLSPAGDRDHDAGKGIAAVINGRITAISTFAREAPNCGRGPTAGRAMFHRAAVSNAASRQARAARFGKRGNPHHSALPASSSFCRISALRRANSAGETFRSSRWLTISVRSPAKRRLARSDTIDRRTFSFCTAGR